MNVLIRSLSLGLAMAGVLAGATFSAAASDDYRTYSVRITNLTKGQVITPPAVIAHRRGYSLFEIGQPASEGLAVLAETGNPGPFADEAALDPNVSAVETGAGIPPGQSLVVEITASKRAKWISVAAMLATTNDAFAAVRALRLPHGKRTAHARAVAYDAGSEANNEDCDFIPGPPCDNGSNDRDTDGAEGFIFVHNGVHGGAGLVPADQDWRNPVLQVEVTRVRGGDEDDD
jgi:hypothetical protein